MARRKEIKGDLTRMTFTLSLSAARRLARAAKKMGISASALLRQLIAQIEQNGG